MTVDTVHAPPRNRTLGRVIRNRARHRATALLLEEFQPRFRVLLTQEMTVATNEAAMLLVMAADLEGVQQVGDIVLLRPGATGGQVVGERIDVGRCQLCQTRHDSGHACPACGWVVE